MMTEEEKKRVEELEDRIMCYIEELDEEIWDVNIYSELPRLKGYKDGLKWTLLVIDEIWREE